MSAANNSLIVAGGGTGGHVLAGVAIADAWKARFGPDVQVTFVGSHGRIEEKLVPRAGYPLELLTLGSLKGATLFQRLRTMFQLPLSLLKSASIVLRVKPRAVIGVGGYSAGPLVVAARFLGWSWRSRIAILEQNAVPGLTNRLLGRVAQKILSAFPGIEAQFPAGKVSVTGNPVRSALSPLPAASREPFTVFIFGGSQGSQPINTLVIEALPHLKDLKGKLRFIHQTGEQDHERVAAAHRDAGTDARVEKFVYDMRSAYAESSLLICRAGSSTLAEIAAVGRASLLIPYPYAADNHQEKNARIFADAGAAELLIQRQATGQTLSAKIREAIAGPARISAMEKAVQAFYRPKAAEEIVEALLS